MNCFRFAFQVPSILVPSYLIATELILAIRVCKKTNVSKTHSKTVTCWHLLAERLCTNTASVTLSPKPVSIIDLSDLEPESTVLARAKENPPGRSRNHLCLEQVNVDKLPIPSWNLTLVRVLALAVSHAVQKPLTLWRTCTPAGNKLVCSVSYILHPC